MRFLSRSAIAEGGGGGEGWRGGGIALRASKTSVQATATGGDRDIAAALAPAYHYETHAGFGVSPSRPFASWFPLNINTAAWLLAGARKSNGASARRLPAPHRPSATPLTWRWRSGISRHSTQRFVWQRRRVFRDSARWRLLSRGRMGGAGHGAVLCSANITAWLSYQSEAKFALSGSMAGINNAALLWTVTQCGNHARL